jgi:hypothetical protein
MLNLNFKLFGKFIPVSNRKIKDTNDNNMIIFLQNSLNEEKFLKIMALNRFFPTF